MRIIKRRSVGTCREYSIDFDYGDGSGFSFPADENGRIREELLSDDALANYEYCISHPELFEEPGHFVSREYNYTTPAIGECVCGNQMELTNEYMGACKCPKCGRWYNLFGQALLDPEYWEDDD